MNSDQEINEGFWPFEVFETNETFNRQLLDLKEISKDIQGVEIWPGPESSERNSDIETGHDRVAEISDEHPIDHEGIPHEELHNIENNSWIQKVMFEHFRKGAINDVDPEDPTKYIVDLEWLHRTDMVLHLKFVSILNDSVEEIPIVEYESGVVVVSNLERVHIKDGVDLVRAIVENRKYLAGREILIGFADFRDPATLNRLFKVDGGPDDLVNVDDSMDDDDLIDIDEIINLDEVFEGDFEDGIIDIFRFDLEVEFEDEFEVEFGDGFRVEDIPDENLMEGLKPDLVRERFDDEESSDIESIFDD